MKSILRLNAGPLLSLISFGVIGVGAILATPAHWWMAPIGVAAFFCGLGSLGFLLENWGNRRSRQLLLSHLSASQRYEMLTRRSFLVKGSDGQWYRIHQRHAYGVSSEGPGPRKYRTWYCGLPWGVPIYDVMLAQKLLIETNVSEFKVRAYTKRPY